MSVNRRGALAAGGVAIVVWVVALLVAQSWADHLSVTADAILHG
jgi:hypothetical protein